MYVYTVKRLNGRTDMTRVEQNWLLVIVFHIFGIIFPNLRLCIVNLQVYKFMYEIQMLTVKRLHYPANKNR